MIKQFFIIIFCITIALPSSAQWKSYYPDGTKNKKSEKKLEDDNSQLKFDIHFYNGLSQKSLENYEEALKEFEKCISIKPENHVPYFESALIYKLFNKKESALESARKAYLLEKNNIWYQLLYAELLSSNGQSTKAAIIYKQMINKFPGNEEYYYLLANNYTFSGKFSEAIKVYNQLEEYKGFDKNLIIQKQKLFLETNNIGGAISEINKIIKLDTTDINAFEILAELYLLHNNREKALKVFEKILKLDPENAKIHLTLADYYREEKQNDASFNHLKEAFSSIKLSIDTKIQILLSYYMLRDNDYEQLKNQALKLCEILIKTHEGNSKAHAIFGDFLYKEGLNIRAKSQYKKVITIDKSRPQVWSQLLFIESELKEFKDLETDSKKAFELFPSNPVYYFFNGIANIQLKNNRKAIESLKMGLEFVIENPELLVQFYSSMGDTYHELNEYKKSDSTYSLVLSIDSNNIQVLNNYSYYLSLRKEKLNLALQMSKKSNELAPNNASFQDTYAWIFYQKEDYKNAKIWLLKAFENGGDKSSVITEHLGDVFYKLGDINKAKAYWIKAESLGDGSEKLRKKLSEENIDE